MKKSPLKEKNVIFRCVVVAAIVIAFLTCSVLLVYKTIYSEERSNIIKDGQMAAIRSAEKFNEYLDTSINAVELSAYTINGMLDTSPNDVILDYIVKQTAAITKLFEKMQ